MDGTLRLWYNSRDGPWHPSDLAEIPVSGSQPRDLATGYGNHYDPSSGAFSHVTTTLDSKSTYTFDSNIAESYPPNTVLPYHQTLRHNPTSSSDTTLLTTDVDETSQWLVTDAEKVRSQGSDATKRAKIAKNNPECTQKTSQGSGDDEEPCTYYMGDPYGKMYEKGGSHEECRLRRFARTSQHNKRKHPPVKCTCGGEYSHTLHAQLEHMETCPGPAQPSNPNLSQLPKPAAEAEKTARTYSWVERFKRDHGPDLSKYPLAESYVEFGKATVGLHKAFESFMQEDERGVELMQLFLGSSQFNTYTKEHEHMKTFINKHSSYYEKYGFGEIVLKPKWIDPGPDTVPARTASGGPINLQQNPPYTASGPAPEASGLHITTSGTYLGPSSDAEVEHPLVQPNQPMPFENPPSTLPLICYPQPEGSWWGGALASFPPAVHSSSQSSTYGHDRAYPVEQSGPSMDGPHVSRKHSGRHRAPGPYRPRRGPASATHDEASNSHHYRRSPTNFATPYRQHQQEAGMTQIPHSEWQRSGNQQVGQYRASQSHKGYPDPQHLLKWHAGMFDYHVGHSVIPARNGQGAPNNPWPHANHGTDTRQDLPRGIETLVHQNVNLEEEERHLPTSNNTEYSQNNTLVSTNPQFNELYESGHVPPPL